MSTMNVFLCHSPEDTEIAKQVVAALRNAGADVWFEESNPDAPPSPDEIHHQIQMRPVFVVLLSKSVFASNQLKSACKSAFEAQQSDSNHIILPVVVAPIDSDDFDQMLFLEDYLRVEGVKYRPYPEPEHMVARTLRLLALTSDDQASVALPSTAPRATDLVDELMTEGLALATQKRWAEAQPVFQRAVEHDPKDARAWAQLGRTRVELQRDAEALTALDRSLALNDQQAATWHNKGIALFRMERYEEALAAHDRAKRLTRTTLLPGSTRALRSVN